MKLAQMGVGGKRGGGEGRGVGTGLPLFLRQSLDFSYPSEQLSSVTGAKVGMESMRKFLTEQFFHILLLMLICVKNLNLGQ